MGRTIIASSDAFFNWYDIEGKVIGQDECGHFIVKTKDEQFFTVRPMDITKVIT